VKTPKKPSKEQPLPTQDESRRTNVLMEQMLSKFDAFGEALSAVREDVNSMKPELHAVKEDVAVLKVAARSHTDAIRANTDAIRTNTEEIRSLKGIVQGHTEAIQAVQTDFKKYSERLEVVEAKLA